MSNMNLMPFSQTFLLLNWTIFSISSLTALFWLDTGHRHSVLLVAAAAADRVLHDGGQEAALGPQVASEW